MSNRNTSHNAKRFMFMNILFVIIGTIDILKHIIVRA